MFKKGFFSFLLNVNLNDKNSVIYVNMLTLTRNIKENKQSDY